MACRLLCVDQVSSHSLAIDAARRWSFGGRSPLILLRQRRHLSPPKESFVTSLGAGPTSAKTRQSRRTIALPAIVIDALQHHKARQSQERLLAGTRWRETGLVFTSTIGTHH